MFSIDNFDIIKEIGKGAYGTVSKVEDKKTKNIYALKTMKKELNKPSSLKRIGEEMVISQMLKDKYIVECFGCWSDDENFYLLFEYSENGDLGKLIKTTEKGFSEATVKKLAKDMFSALSYCHYHRICHRDLKPANILVFKEGNEYVYKLADFGISDRVDGKENTPLCITGLCGTSNYIAPEILIARDDEVEGYSPAGSFYSDMSEEEEKLPIKYGYNCDRSDVWALGVTLVYALTGHLPFKGRTYQHLYDSIKHDEPNLEGVPESAKSFILKLLDKDPRKRYTPQQAFRDPWLNQK